MTTFTTYYETGSLRRGTLKAHKKDFSSKKKAVAHAKKLSKRTRAFVTVQRGGREVAECLKGSCRVW